MKIIDMHCDTISALRAKKAANPADASNLFENQLQMDLVRMKQGGYLLQNFALYVNLQEESDPLEAAFSMADLFYTEMEKYSDTIRPVTTYKEILENEQQGRMSALLTLEEGAICKGSLSNLRNLYRLGARMMTLTWNYDNQLGSPNYFPWMTDSIDPLFEKVDCVSSSNYAKLPSSPAPGGNETAPGSSAVHPHPVHGRPNPAGLKEKGFAFLTEMERLGMIIDVSHLSDGGFYDVYEHTTRPFVASHSNARSLCPNCRNLTDDMIRKIGERGGVIGLNYYGNFLTESVDGTSQKSTLSAISRHARHIANTGGIHCLGLGSDFDGFDGETELYDCSRLPLLEDALRQQQFSSSEIDQICYKNVLNLYKEILR